jgi:hypothetical protein
MFQTCIELTIIFAIVSCSFVSGEIKLSEDKEENIDEANMTNRIYMSLHNVSLLILERHLKSANQELFKSNDSTKLPFYLPSLSSILGIDPFKLPNPIEISHRNILYPQLGVLDLNFSQIMIAGLSNYKMKKISKEGKNIVVQHLLPNLTAHTNYSVNFSLFDDIPWNISKGQLMVNIKNVHLNVTFCMFPNSLKSLFKVVKLNLTAWSVDEPSMVAFPEFLISREYRMTDIVVGKINSFIQSLMPNLTQYLKFNYTKLVEL